MRLIGMYDSPFVRRVAVSMQLLDIDFVHENWSVGKDFNRIREFNPLVRVPTLVLDDGEVLCESAAILDYVDHLVGPARSLLPNEPRARRQALNVMSIAVGAAEKGREVVYERAFRPAEKRHAAWVERCQTQMHGGLAWLERLCAPLGADQWLGGAALGQSDITLACAFTFLSDSQRPDDLAARYGATARLTARCEALAAFQSTRDEFSPPQG